MQNSIKGGHNIFFFYNIAIKPKRMDFGKARDYALKRLSSELNQNLCYHNLDHTLDVCESVARLAELEQINSQNRIILETAALFHELGMINTYEGHEESSIKIATETLSAFGYSEADLKLVCELISVTRLESVPGNIFEEVLCDADLDYLGRSDYIEVSAKLRKEWELVCSITYQDQQWFQLQLEFLSNHHYYSKSARNLRDNGKNLNINRIKNILNVLLNENI
jgi:predicted metal-dependent HD superfamily phosphohydrolase